MTEDQATIGETLLNYSDLNWHSYYANLMTEDSESVLAQKIQFLFARIHADNPAVLKYLVHSGDVMFLLAD